MSSVRIMSLGSQSCLIICKARCAGATRDGKSCRAVDWWWELLPRWIFFLLLAGFAIGVMVALKRVAVAARRVK